MGSGGSSHAKGGHCREVHEDHDESINCVAVSEDGSLLITGSEDSTARMWSTRTDPVECIGVLKGHGSYINAVALVDTYAVTASADHTVRKWDITTCECLFVYEGHKQRIMKLVVTPDFIFTSSYDKTAKAWLFDTSDIKDGHESEACIKTFVGHTRGVFPLVFLPAEDFDQYDGATINPGDTLITGSADSTARSWSVESEGCLKIFKGHSGPVTCMTVDNAGKILFTASADSTIKAWNIASGNLLRTMKGHEGAIISLQMVNRLMYTGSADGDAKCWVSEYGDCTRIYKGHKHSVITTKFDKGVLFTGCGDAIVRAYDAKSGTLKRTYTGHSGAINCVLVSDNKIFTGSSDSTLRVWDGLDLQDDLAAGEDADGVGVGGVVPVGGIEPRETLSSLERTLDDTLERHEEECDDNSIIQDDDVIAEEDEEDEDDDDNSE